jgi:hypothetical protein
MIEKQSYPRSCGQELLYNRKCPHCGRAHYNPGKRKVVTRWGRGTRVRILTGEHAGKMAEVWGVNHLYVLVRVQLGTKKKPEWDVYCYTASELRRSSGPMVNFP